MLNRITTILRQQSLGAVALFVALGGTSYAAINLPRDSVGAKQLRAGSVTPSKLATRSFGGHILFTAKIALGGKVISSSPKGATTVSWVSHLSSYSGGVVRWHRSIPAGCSALAGADSSAIGGPGGVPFASAELFTGSAKRALADVAMPYDTPVSVVVVCPE